VTAHALRDRLPQETRQILAARRTAAPRDDVVLTPEQAVLLTDVDFGERPLASFLVDPDAGQGPGVLAIRPACPVATHDS
jgi:hypothetical protein